MDARSKKISRNQTLENKNWSKNWVSTWEIDLLGPPFIRARKFRPLMLNPNETRARIVRRSLQRFALDNQISGGANTVIAFLIVAPIISYACVS